MSFLFRGKLRKFLATATFSMIAVTMNGCDAIYWDEAASLQEIQKRDSITVVTVDNPLIYNKSKSGEAYGIDHDLLQNFANTYNLKVIYKRYPNTVEAQRAFEGGEGDLLAARLRFPEKRYQALPGPAYEDTHLNLYCHQKAGVQHIQDLAGKRVYAFPHDLDSQFIKRLEVFAPGVELNLLTEMNHLKAFKDVQTKQADCVISEATLGAYYLRFASQVVMVSPLTRSFSLHWWLRPDDIHLSSLAFAWFQQASRNDDIMLIQDRYKTFLSELDRADVRRFMKNIREKLPEFYDHFVDASKENNLPWQLVAAIAYQESHWEPSATSFTGVKGIMQLTKETAAHLGVEDREDPEQSIYGGSKYIRMLYNRTPKNLNYKDRLALALAAYNVGWAHLMDAQKLAVEKGLNPHSWRHLKKVLPLLADPRYAEQLQYGPARGYETVDFVERVKSFYNILLAQN